MDITAERRAQLADALTRGIGKEAADTMMAHLPEGGVRALATKEDVANLDDRVANLDGRMDRMEIRMDHVVEGLHGLNETVTHLGRTMSQMTEPLTQVVERGEMLRKEFIAEAAAQRERLAAMDRAQRAELAAETNRLRAEWRTDLGDTLARQTLIQVGTLLTIIVASLAYITYVLP